jgi:hypothetical protein
MRNVGRCARCGKFLIEEEHKHHECELQTVDTREIVVDHFYELTKRDSDGHKLLVAQGLDGIQYWLVGCKHNPPHSTKRPFTSYGTKQGLDSPSKTAVVPSRQIRFAVTFRLMSLSVLLPSSCLSLSLS